MKSVLIKNITHDDIEYFLNIVAESENKATTHVYRSLGHHAMLNYRSGDLSFKLLQDDVVTALFGIIFKKFCPFFESFNKKIDQMISAGIVSQFSNRGKIKIRFDEIGPQILTWDHLSVGFAACTIPLIISIVVFFCEYLGRKMKVF